MEHIGMFLGKILDMLDMKQKEAAAACSMSQSEMSRLISGNRPASYEQIVCISRGLKIPIAALFPADLHVGIFPTCLDHENTPHTIPYSDFVEHTPLYMDPDYKFYGYILNFKKNTSLPHYEPFANHKIDVVLSYMCLSGGGSFTHAGQSIISAPGSAGTLLAIDVRDLVVQKGTKLLVFAVGSDVKKFLALPSFDEYMHEV